MVSGWPSIITGVAYSLINLFFGLATGEKKTYRTWSAFFIVLALRAGLAVIYQEFNRFHGQAFLILLTTAATAGSFLFLAANMTVAKPNWKWLHWIWPLMGLLGLLTGGSLATLPNYYSVTVTWTCLILSVLILQKAANKSVRNWICGGVVVKVASVLAINIIHGSGWMGPMALEHALQIGSSFCFWAGARKT